MAMGPHDPLIRPCYQVYIFVIDGNNKLCDATQEAQTVKAMYLMAKSRQKAFEVVFFESSP